MRNDVLEIGTTIRKRRELLGLLQAELASISEISIRTIQLVEIGKANPSVETLIKIASPLGLTIKLSLRETDTSEQNLS
jgi:transcriptional regulator with XRE-family HTH domain